MSSRPELSTRNLSGLSQQSNDAANSPAEQRDDAKRNFLKTMRALPTQHYWDVYFDRAAPKDQQQGGPETGDAQQYNVQIEQLGTQIASVQDFWRYANNTPIDQIKMRESIYLFKSGFRPVWEDRRNVLGGSWTFRVPKSIGPDVWTRVQLLAIGEKLQSVLDEGKQSFIYYPPYSNYLDHTLESTTNPRLGDQLCGVGLSIRFNAHLISIWHRDASKKNSIDAILACVMEELPAELRPKPDAYFYKRHSDHSGFNPPPELQAVLDSRRREEAAQQASSAPNESPQ